MSSKQKFYPVIIIFTCLIGMGAYMLLSAPDTQKPGSNFAPLPPKTSGPSEVGAQQQHFLLKHYGGETTSGKQAALVARIGTALATRSEAKEGNKTLHFHLLAETNRIDMFAFPDGNIYVTTAFVNRMHTEGELAAPLASGVAHVMLGHAMQTSVAIDTPNISMPAIFSFTREQESASDERALKAMADAGYDPQSMINMYRILTEAYKAHADVDFFTTHPSDQWRLTNVDAAIKKMYPKGVPAVLSK